MNNLGGFLQKFKKIIGDRRSEDALISEAIVTISGVKISSQAISVREGTLYLSVRPIERTEIFLRKKEILARLIEQGLPIKDLR